MSNFSRFLLQLQILALFAFAGTVHAARPAEPPTPVPTTAPTTVPEKCGDKKCTGCDVCVNGECQKSGKIECDDGRCVRQAASCECKGVADCPQCTVCRAGQCMPSLSPAFGIDSVRECPDGSCVEYPFGRCEDQCENAGVDCGACGRCTGDKYGNYGCSYMSGIDPSKDECPSGDMCVATIDRKLQNWACPEECGCDTCTEYCVKGQNGSKECRRSGRIRCKDGSCVSTYLGSVCPEEVPEPKPPYPFDP